RTDYIYSRLIINYLTLPPPCFWWSCLVFPLRFLPVSHNPVAIKPLMIILRQFAEGYELDYEYLMFKAGYLDEPRHASDDEYFMFKDKEGFDSLPEEDKEKILLTLREQADFMISKYKKR